MGNLKKDWTRWKASSEIMNEKTNENSMFPAQGLSLEAIENIKDKKIREMLAKMHQDVNKKLPDTSKSKPFGFHLFFSH
jgi:hypothetical protein